MNNLFNCISAFSNTKSLTNIGNYCFCTNVAIFSMIILYEYVIRWSLSRIIGFLESILLSSSLKLFNLPLSLIRLSVDRKIGKLFKLLEDDIDLFCLRLSIVIHFDTCHFVCSAKLNFQLSIALQLLVHLLWDISLLF